MAVLVLPLFSNAQQSGTLFLQLQPSMPEPGDEYTVSSLVQGNNMPKASQKWFINGSEVSEFANQSKITLTAQETPSAVSSRVVFTNGDFIDAKITVSPARIDFVVTPQTLTPAFYKGAALPSNGSSFTVTALVFKNGIEQTGLSYAWSINGKSQNGGAVRNLSSISHTPGFGGDVPIAVEVYDAQNRKIAEDSIVVPVVKPEIVFYEHNPLRGLSKVALREPHILVGDEMTVRGEAYYIGAHSALSDLHTEWKVDGTTVNASSEDRQEIVLEKKGVTGRSVISFHIRNLTDLLQGAKESLTITF